MGRRAWSFVCFGLACIATASCAPHRFIVDDHDDAATGFASASPTSSGYLSVNASSGAKMYFTFYEALEQQSTAQAKNPTPQTEEEVPIVLWLQGGPGCSSMVGNFFELGPWLVGADQALHRNPTPWNRIFGLLFLDNPVGAGFSIAPSREDIPVDQYHVARDVYTALQGFFDQFPDFRNRPLYLTGESYAGKYVPSVANYIIEKQEEQKTCVGRITGSSSALRLDGIAIGNGLIHPIAQVLLHAPTAYSMGLIDEVQSAYVDKLAAKTVSYIEEESWAEAHHARNKLLDYIQNVTGLATLYDVRRTTEYYTTQDGVDYLSAFLNKVDVQKELLRAEAMTWEPCNNAVSERMFLDVPKSTKNLVEVLLNRSIPVLLYQGQFDLRDGVASSEAWMQVLQWDKLNDFYASERKVWNENNVKAGYVRSYASLTHVVISNAGHLAPADQGYPSQRMIEGWISGEGIA